jgi:hypothetical protein
MALTKVGASPAPGGNLALMSNLDTAEAYFTPTSTWTVGDVLVFAASVGSNLGTPTIDATFTNMARVLHDLGGAAGQWTEAGTFQQNTFDGYWWVFYHAVTAQDLIDFGSSGDIIAQVELTNVTGGQGYIRIAGGVAVRPVSGETVTNSYVPADGSDTDNSVSLSGASPQVGVFPLTAPYYSGDTLLYYVSSGDWNFTDLTAVSVAWTGPTELDDDFRLNADGSHDTGWASAYELLAAGASYPASTTTRTWTGVSTPGSYGWRAIIEFEGTIDYVHGDPDYNYPYDRRRVSAKALPYNLNTGLLRDL